MINLEELLASIEERRPKLIDLGLDRVHAVLKATGSPHEKLPLVFHIAGTNGKGSTTAFLRSILEESGRRVHVYTSPHLVRYNERIVIAGAEISDDALVNVLTRCDQVAGDHPLSFFEMLTCAAFLAFSETPADVCLIEVGLGGRLDATNVVAAPAAAVITPIAVDHQEYLGETIAEIAAEKAGIIKPGAPVIIGQQQPDVMTSLMAAARQVNADVFSCGREWDVWAENGQLIFQDQFGLSDLAPPRLAGDHQLANAGLAIAALKAVGFDISDRDISTGLQNARWPARMQQLRSGPVIDEIVNAGFAPEVWLDGGHNAHAAKALAVAFAGLEEKSAKPLYLIFGMQKNKDPGAYLSYFSGLASGIVATQAEHTAVAEPSYLVEAARKNGLNAQQAGSVRDAIKKITETADGPFRLLICGSLYLAGDVLRHHT